MHFAHTESEFELVYRLRVKFSTFHEVFFLFSCYRTVQRLYASGFDKGCDGSYAHNTAM